jgi:hypothetical protein
MSHYIPIKLQSGKPKDSFPAIAQLATLKPNSIRVSQAFNVPPQPFFFVIHDALLLIDQIHGDGNLPLIQIKKKKLQNNTRAGFDPDQNELVFDSTGTPNLTDALHEVFHVLDHYGFDTNKVASDDPNYGSLYPVITAIYESEYWKDLKEIKFEKPRFLLQDQEKVFRFQKSKEEANYIRSIPELLARAYVQYIGIRTGQPELLKELGEQRSTKTYQLEYDEAWNDSDFQTIAQAFDQVLVSKRWAI